MKPLAISLPGGKPEGSEALEAALGAAIRWDAENFEIRFPPGTLDTPVDQADPVLREALEDIARREVTMRSGGSAVARVRAAILHLGFERTSAIGQVAARLGTTARTLQRWHAVESRTYSEVRKEVLREAALSMFATDGAPLEEIALRLGFSSRSGFHRAIKRWTGKEPGGLRARSSLARVGDSLRVIWRDPVPDGRKGGAASARDVPRPPIPACHHQDGQPSSRCWTVGGRATTAWRGLPDDVAVVEESPRDGYLFAHVFLLVSLVVALRWRGLFHLHAGALLSDRLSTGEKRRLEPRLAWRAESGLDLLEAPVDTVGQLLRTT